jgi:hypothetical protein
MTDAEGPDKVVNEQRDRGAASAGAEADVRQAAVVGQARYDPQALQVGEYLWEEYRYRHDLVWQLVFRVTAVATALLIAPFLIDKSVVEVLGNWLLCLPLVAILVILTGFYVLLRELEPLKKIRNAYREIQNRALHHLEPQWTPHKIPLSAAKGTKLTLRQRLKRSLAEHFEVRVSVFMLLLLVTAIAFFLLFYFNWLPTLTTRV